MRVAFIPNVAGASGADQSLNKVVLAALTVLDPVKATKYVAQLLEDEGCHERQDCDILVSGTILPTFVFCQIRPPIHIY